jgi:predicted RNA-binding protein with PIN domain
MHFVVDGYNAARRLFGREGAGATPEELREALLRRLRRFATRRRKVTVVFDGKNRPPGVPSRFTTAGVDVVFAPSADEAIVAMVRGAPDPGRLTVVSRDREVEGRSVQLGARSARVVDFLDELERAAGPDIEPGEPPEKYD